MAGEPVTADPGWSRMWDLFHEASELPAAEREAFLQRECAGDERLRAEVAGLLAASERAEEFLEPQGASKGIAALGSETIPERIGRYRVLERIGEGGFADVYLAEQKEPVARRVAIKVLKPGMDSRAVIARFETERQTLALVEHPGIATVLDAGLSGQGRPYVVMEYIAGLPITRHCDERQLGTEARLELFQQVCQAVQHAHHKGVIHRDLKPSNVMVTEAGGRAQVKVIDFGIAKAIDQSSGGRTLFTEAGQLIGTPEYMSPEQAAGIDLDTRTDVYALGVLLYELLVGLRPGEPRRDASPSEILAELREREAPRPSTRLLGCGREAATRIAAARATGDVATLARQVRGDLDWIVMKAIDKERTRRYSSPAELVADLLRHGRHEPVLAGPPSALYRLRKFARRHRAGVAAAAVALVLAPVAIVHLALTARTEQRLRQEAEEAGAAADQGRRAAQENARVAETVSRFFSREVLAGADPRKAANPDLKMRDVLDIAAERVTERFAKEPLIEATIRQTLGDTYRSLGLFAKALPHLERAAELFATTVGEADMRAQQAKNDLAILYGKQGRFADAERAHKELLELRRRALGPDDRETLITAVNLGSLYNEAGRLAEADQVLSEARERMVSVLGEEHEGTILATQHLAAVYVSREKLAQAEPLLRSTIAHQEKTRGQDHPYTIAAVVQLAHALAKHEKHEQAGPLYERVLEATLRRAGEDHLDTAIARFNLGVHYLRCGRLADAEPVLVSAGARIEAALGADHPTTLTAKSFQGTVCYRGQRYAEAEPLFAAAAGGGRRVLKRTDPNLGTYYVDHGLVLHRLGRSEEAEPLLAEGQAILAKVLGEGSARSRNALAELVLVQEALGKTGAAEASRSKLRELEARR
jgi:non-specific serine/threonine protein kinase/serine/threonine-protein kinase